MFNVQFCGVITIVKMRKVINDKKKLLKTYVAVFVNIIF